MRRHLSRHGGHPAGDALTLFVEQTRLLRDLVGEWEATVPPAEPGGDLARRARRHGTVGKLILEHAAVRLAARDDLIRVLRGCGRDDDADGLAGSREDLADVVRRLDHQARGVQPVSVGKQAEFADAAASYERLLREDPADDLDAYERHLADALGDERGKLHSSGHLRSHAPTHPSEHPHWYQHLPLVQRVHATYDRLRGFPWAESEPFADPVEAARFDPGR
jgi:hypothetical protein